MFARDYSYHSRRSQREELIVIIINEDNTEETRKIHTREIAPLTEKERTYLITHKLTKQEFFAVKREIAKRNIESKRGKRN